VNDETAQWRQMMKNFKYIVATSFEKLNSKLHKNQDLDDFEKTLKSTQRLR
jgi:primosomal protein N'